jgi:hypothetical protein
MVHHPIQSIYPSERYATPGVHNPADLQISAAVVCPAVWYACVMTPASLPVLPVLVLAPVLKVLEQRVQLVVRVALQVAVDGDVPPVANLL